jgi:hypothetical protein
LTATPNMHTATQIASRLSISPELTLRVLDFLLENGLCIKTETGISYGPGHTHIGVESPHTNRHHQNWRHRAINQMSLKNSRDLFYTAPVSLSEEDAERVRNEILKSIESILKIIRPSRSEVVRCLCLDFFEY